MITKEQLDYLAHSGIQFYATFEVPAGGGDMTLNVDQVLAYLKDKEAVIADYLGVDPDDYMLWLDSEGTVFCAGTTKLGKRCRNLISRPQLSIREWITVRAEKHCCKAHGE